MADDISRILDQYGAEPDASNVSGMRERRQLAILQPPPSRPPDWAQSYPTVYDFLTRGLPLAMMALPGRSNLGASIGRDAVLANRYWQRALRERPYAGTGDITGGRPKVPVTNNTRNWAPYAESSAGLSRDPRWAGPVDIGLSEPYWMPRKGMREASLPDQLMIFPETLGIPRTYPNRAYNQPEGAFWPKEWIGKPANDMKPYSPPKGQTHQSRFAEIKDTLARMIGSGEWTMDAPEIQALLNEMRLMIQRSPKNN